MGKKSTITVRCLLVEAGSPNKENEVKYRLVAKVTDKRKSDWKNKKVYSGFIYSSEEEASNDLMLFKFFWADKEDDHPPKPGFKGQRWNWSVYKPDNSWNKIRTWLENSKKIESVEALGVGPYNNKRAYTDIDVSSRRDHAFIHVPSEFLEDEVSEETAPLVRIKKSFSELDPNRKRLFGKSFKILLKELWEDVAPNQTSEMVIALRDMFNIPQDSVLDEFKNVIVRSMNVLNEKDLVIQYGSILWRAGMSREDLESFLGVAIPGRLFTEIHYHHDQYGAGSPVPSKKYTTRGNERKWEVVQKFVAHLLANGHKTAEGVDKIDSKGVEYEFLLSMIVYIYTATVTS